jgi:hypothetical protein
MMAANANPAEQSVTGPTSGNSGNVASSSSSAPPVSGGNGGTAAPAAPSQGSTPVVNQDGPEQADRVEKAMGDLLDQVQDQTSFPVDTPGSKPSTSSTYNVGAHLHLNIRANWVLFDGFELTNVKLGLAVSKRTHANGRPSQSLCSSPRSLIH